jgi:hypothetical protein
VANTSANIVRGAAGWGGPDTDAFIAYVQWDEQNLYLAAHVLSPAHQQNETGPSVWKGDALWVYLNPQRERSSVANKLTLAQTPDGPQVWNWKANNFLPGAQLAWQQGDGFYNYEAALPWKALGVDQAETGGALGLEVGRGCCGGGGFQDLSGADPDVAANLIALTLADSLQPAPPASAASQFSGPDAVALLWTLDQGTARSQSQADAPDRDYLWLARLTSLPVELAAGPHTLRFEYAGADPARTANIDGFLLLPATLTRRYSGPQGSLVLTYDVSLGKWNLAEERR